MLQRTTVGKAFALGGITTERPANDSREPVEALPYVGRASPGDSWSNCTTALLARPFSGGAVTLIFRASPSQPTIPSRDDPGITFTLRRADGSAAFPMVPYDPVSVRF